MSDRDSSLFSVEDIVDLLTNTKSYLYDLLPLNRRDLDWAESIHALSKSSRMMEWGGYASNGVHFGAALGTVGAKVDDSFEEDSRNNNGFLMQAGWQVFRVTVMTGIHGYGTLSPTAIRVTEVDVDYRIIQCLKISPNSVPEEAPSAKDILFQEVGAGPILGAYERYLKLRPYLDGHISISRGTYYLSDYGFVIERNGVLMTVYDDEGQRNEYFFGISADEGQLVTREIRTEKIMKGFPGSELIQIQRNEYGDLLEFYR